MHSNRLLKSRLVHMLLIVVLLLLQPMPVFALSGLQRSVISSGIGYFNINDPNICTERSGSSTVGLSRVPDGSAIYTMGDSLTVGMRDHGGLAEKYTAQGWSATRITAVGGEDIDWGIGQLDIQTEIDAVRNSTVALVGLGTNNVGEVVEGDNIKPGGRESVSSKATTMINKLRSINPDLIIYWTNVYMTGPLNTQYGYFNMDVARPVLNEAIESVARANGVNIVPWATSSEAANLVNDGIHPGGNYPEMADYIVGQLASGGSSAAPSGGGCTCSVESLPGVNNIERTFNYFNGQKGLSAEIAAGIIGNMMNESPGVAAGEGPIEPQQLQGEFDVKVSSEEAITIAVPGSSLGWGIVQWTPGTKIIQTSADAGVGFAEIDTLNFQLDFLWGQLTGEGSRGDPNNAYNERSAGDRIFASTTVEEATINFGRYYERFGGSDNLNNPEYQERIDAALEVLNTVRPGGAVAVSCTNDRQAGPNGWDLPGEGAYPMEYYSQRSDGNDPAVLGYYGSSPYGPGPISYCGCGPTSWAMIVSTLTNNKTDPAAVAQWAYENGFQQEAEGGGECGGSEWWWADNPALTATRWGVSATRINGTLEAEQALRRGSLVLVSVGDGPFTSNGHLLVMRQVTGDGKFLFADPNDYNDTRPIAQELFGGQSKSRTPLAPEDFMGSVKALWEVRAI